MPDGGDFPSLTSARDDEQLATFGSSEARRVFGAENVERWTSPTFAQVTLTDNEAEELALSMGHHRNLIRDEGRGSWEAGYDERGAGLFLAVGATNALLDRIRQAREEAGDGNVTLGLSQMDLVNALGTDSYGRIIRDHRQWMDSLDDRLVENGRLLGFFKADFRDLERSHEAMQSKLRRAEIAQRIIEQARAE